MPSGYVDVPTSVSGLDLRCHWWTSDDPTNNRSRVYAQMQGRKTDGYTTYGTYEGDVYLNGAWRGISSATESMPPYGGWQDLGGSTSQLIGHNSDGTKTTTVGARGRIPGTSFGSTQSGTGSVTLTDYDRRPSAPRNLEAVVTGPTSVELSWDAPSTTGAGIIEYEVRIHQPGQSSGALIVQGYTGSRTFQTDDLLPGTSYGANVRARTSDGWGSWTPFTNWETISGMYVSDGSSWIPAPVFVSDGTTWKPAEVYVSDGTDWIPAG